MRLKVVEGYSLSLLRDELTSISYQPTDMGSPQDYAHADWAGSLFRPGRVPVAAAAVGGLARPREEGDYALLSAAP